MLFDESGDTPNAPSSECLVGSLDKLSTDAAPSVFWEDGEPVDVAAPSIEGCDDRAHHDAIGGLCDKTGEVVVAQGAFEIIHRVGRTRRGVCRIPQRQKHCTFVGAQLSNPHHCVG